MKKVIILVAAGVLSFVVGTTGIYMVMPNIAPAVVDSTRIRLDSLGLLARAFGDTLRAGVGADSLHSSPFDTLGAAAGSDPSDSLNAGRNPDGHGPISLEDSLRNTRTLNRNLQSDNAAFIATIEELTERIKGLESQRAEAADLTKSLSTLDERQLGNILGSLDLEVVKMLYLQATARERSRLLQNLPPNRAAQFVKALVGAEDVDAAENDSATGPAEPDAVTGANAGPSNQ